MYCSECGLPKGIGKANAWRPNGVIVSRYEKDLRGIFHDVVELEHLFTSLSGIMGYDVTRMVVEGKRKDSAHYTRGLLRSIAESGTLPPGPEEFFRIMAANYSVPGFGKVEIVSYREGEGIVLDMKDVYNVAMAQGQAAGVFEGVLDHRGEVSWEGDGNSGRVTLTLMAGEAELERRIGSEVEAAEPLLEEGEIEYELCPGCGAPRDLGREFDWDVDMALITERRSGRRFIFDNTRGMAAVMRLLVEELGEEVEQTLMEISRDYARGYYGALGGRTGLEDEFARLSLWGWGLPVPGSASGERRRVRLVNPFSEPIMQGRVWGLVEAAGGLELRVAGRDRDRGATVLELSPA